MERIKVKAYANNQYKIYTTEGVYFQSYDSIIAFLRYADNRVFLDEQFWDYSTTTGKYRNKFLGESKKETQKKIDAGEYILANLN